MPLWNVYCTEGTYSTEDKRAFASQMPETGANKLQDYGVSFLTSAAQGKSSARAKLELRERAQKLQSFVKEKFGVHTVVGIGRTLPPGATV